MIKILDNQGLHFYLNFAVFDLVSLEELPKEYDSQEVRTRVTLLHKNSGKQQVYTLSLEAEKLMLLFL